MQMTISEFKMLAKGQQEKWILDNGSFIAVRQEPEFVIRLYQSDSFFVELFYHQVQKAPITIKPFTSTDVLESYLDGNDLCFVNY
jgi:hypothetical protein